MGNFENVATFLVHFPQRINFYLEIFCFNIYQMDHFWFGLNIRFRMEYSHSFYLFP